jgi:hypothetical protein
VELTVLLAHSGLAAQEAPADRNNAGGGGGGYYGGGGGGGSSFVEVTATNVSHSQATFGECDTGNNGCIMISW